MREVPPALQSHLDTGATTLCWCWLIVRRDTTRLGFTNHDRNLSFGGDTYEASTGFLGTEANSSLGLSVDNMDVEGAIDSVRIAEVDLVGGLYDDAEIQVWLVNWSDTSQRMLMKTGNLGEISRGKTYFKAEVRGLAARLQQKRGRIYQYTCDAKLGDARCGINLESSTYKGSGSVTSTNGRSTIIASGLGSYADNWFSRGKITFTSGDNSGVSIEVRSHRLTSGVVSLTLWAPSPFTIAPSDTFEIRAGCDKLFKTCKAKFNNRVNFRGFPHIPGNDFVVSYANKGDAGMDGGGNFVGAD